MKDDGSVFAWGLANLTAERGARAAPFPFEPSRKAVRIAAYPCANTMGTVEGTEETIEQEKLLTYAFRGWNYRYC